VKACKLGYFPTAPNLQSLEANDCHPAPFSDPKLFHHCEGAGGDVSLASHTLAGYELVPNLQIESQNNS